MNKWWYLFKCESATCLTDEVTFSVRTSKQNLKEVKCPMCDRVCLNPFKWVSDVDGGGGPDEPIVAYVRNTVTKIRNDIHNSRKDVVDLSKKATTKLDTLWTLAKQKWDEAAKEVSKDNGENL